jgi:hypothetical protein
MFISNVLSNVAIRCASQTKLNSRPIVTNIPVLSSLSPPRPVSSSAPTTSRSPKLKNLPTNRVVNNHSTPILPSHASLPPTHPRPPSSTSSTDNIESNDVKISDSRTRRRLQINRNSPLQMNGQPLNLEFLSKLSYNDTLQRRRRDYELQNHVKHSHQPLSSDEHDKSTIESSNACELPHAIVSRRTTRICRLDDK